MTRPHFGFIFCFGDLENAKEFAIQYDGILLEGIGVPASKKNPVFFSSCDLDEFVMRRGWLGDSDINQANWLIAEGLPKGTILMRTFRPTKIIEL